MEEQGNFSLESLRGSDNISSHVFSKNIILTDGILVTAGIVILIENAISIALLWKCSRLPFQIRILTLNLAISDILTGFFLALPNTLLYETYQCVSLNCDHDEHGPLLRVRLRNALLYIHYKETSSQAVHPRLGFWLCSYVWHVF